MNLFNARIKSSEKIIASLERRIEFLKKRSNRYSTYRLILFITGSLITIAAYLISKELGWIITGLFAAVFSITVHCHNKLIMTIRRYETFLKIKTEHLSRMKIDWENIPEPIINQSPDEISIGKDLDLFGKRSLHHLTDVSVSLEGSLLLRKWLTNFTPDLNSILERQRIIKELSAKTGFRDKFLLRSRLISRKYLQCGSILNWINNSSEDELPGWLFPLSALLILSYISLFILSALEIVPSLWFVVFLIYFVLYSQFSKKLGKIIDESIELDGQFKKFSSLIFLINKYSFKSSPALNEFIISSFGQGAHSSVKLEKLQKITSALLIRDNQIFKLILNVLFPYDVFFCQKLIKLKPQLVTDIPFWLERLNELECYISLSNFTDLNPDYVFPEIESNLPNSFQTKKIGHPLLKRENKISNDFSLTKENEILIITGSNMSGKSTFLKTLGINLCLANAGAPVNAEYLRTSLYELFSCIKVNDSVSDGISYFYAEVKRLKELLDEYKNEKHLPIFFLIDEIFKGTNNRERLIGSRAFIKRLSELNGTGAVTTHDLELVNLSDEISKITNYHFREEIVNDKMSFDYKIHDGPCPTTNALKIMELAGLPVK